MDTRNYFSKKLSFFHIIEFIRFAKVVSRLNEPINGDGPLRLADWVTSLEGELKEARNSVDANAALALAQACAISGGNKYRLGRWEGFYARRGQRLVRASLNGYGLDFLPLFSSEPLVLAPG